MVRPGLAQTQAVLARELTGGTDEASRLFRQSVTLTRQVERSRIELARLTTLPSLPRRNVRARVLRATLDSSQKEQLATQAALADFPRFRAVTSDTIALADLQKILRPGEAYYRMTTAGDNVYAMLVTPTRRARRSWSRPASSSTSRSRAARHHLDDRERPAGHLSVRRRFVAPALCRAVRPVRGVVPAITHLIFEPDGALLRLPPNLLVMDQASVDAYQQRAKTGDAAAYDFRGIAWLGRDRDISTRSARAPSLSCVSPAVSGAQNYLGLGENTPPSASAERA